MTPQEQAQVDAAKKNVETTLVDVYHKVVELSEEELTKLKAFAEKLLARTSTPAK